MAKQQQSQWKAPQLDPHQQEALMKLSQHMGNPLDEFDMEVGDEIERLHGERSAQKMKAALRGGDLGPEQFEQEQAQQGQAMQNLQALQGAQQAQQAQAAQTGVNAPPAPTGTAGVTTPYPAQAKPGAVPTTGKAPQQQPAAPGEEEAPEEPGQ
jgi:hypothetical protein